MKNTKNILIVSTLLLSVLCVQAIAQGQYVTKAKYDEIEKARAKTHQLSRIVTTVASKHKDKKVLSITKYVEEYESPERYRTRYWETKDGKTTLVRENVYYDGREFVRENGTVWKEPDKLLSSFTVGEQIASVEQFAIGKSRWGEKTVDYYSSYEVFKIDNYLIFNETVDYLNDDGTLLGQVIRGSLMFPANITRKSETKYEYNQQNLVIRIPVIPGKEK